MVQAVRSLMMAQKADNIGPRRRRLDMTLNYEDSVCREPSCGSRAGVTNACTLPRYDHHIQACHGNYITGEAGRGSQGVES